MTAPARADVVYVEAYQGMWIARCGRPWCTNALALDRGQTRFECVALDGCGWFGEAIWPADPDAIEAILAVRPVPGTRNWLPGETLAQLLEENAVHGCIPDEWVELGRAQPGGGLEIMFALDERVVGGVLYQQLEAAGRREIGA